MTTSDVASVTRRDLFKAGGSGVMSLALTQQLAIPSAAAASALRQKRACILLWMDGGPSHLDTWDPKPGTPTGGPFRSIRTSAPGVAICEHMPQIAEQAEHLAIIRSMTSGEGNHQRARHLLHTGHALDPTVPHPSLGSRVAAELHGPQSVLPSLITLRSPNVTAFVGDAFDDAHGVQILPPLTSARGLTLPLHIGSEPAGVRAAYGDTDFGRRCLAARRLVEAGAKFVEVVMEGWDTHDDNFGRTARLIVDCDSAMSALIRDLQARDLLATTLIVWMGEFGRTPQINRNDGRDHYPAAWSVVLAGGGVRGGQAYGQTDGEGAKVVDRPVKAPDLIVTIAALLDIHPAGGRPVGVGLPSSIAAPGAAIRDLIAPRNDGRLRSHS